MRALDLLVIVHCTCLPLQAVLLNEIMSNPSGSESTDEYIELIQPDSLGLDLAGWSISDGAAAEGLIGFGGGSMVLAAGSLALILDSGYAGAFDHLIPPGTLLLTVADGTLGSAGLSNSAAEPISLVRPDGSVADLIHSRPSLEDGFSLERREGGSYCDSCWAPTQVSGGTPGGPNSICRRTHDLRLVYGMDSCRVRATGLTGFRGELDVMVGRAPCLRMLRFEDLALDPGEEAGIRLPDPPLWLQNPLIVRSCAQDGSERILLDTLLWQTPRPGTLYFELVQPAGLDWLQIAQADSCPCLLDGLELSARGFTRDLEGWLQPGERLLVGNVAPQCPETRSLDRSIVLARGGMATLIDPLGTILDSAVWPDERSPEDVPWQRVDPAQPGDDPGNWMAHGEQRPGCSTDDLPSGAGDGAGWWVNQRLLQPGVRARDLLVITSPAGLGQWSMELWSLAGELLVHREVDQERLVWNGRVGRLALPAGLYLLRLSGSGRSQMQSLAIAPEHMP